MGNKREVYAGLGGVFILFAVLTNRILSIDVPLMDGGIGFSGVRVCMMGECESSSDHTGLGTFAFWLGLLTVAGLVGAVVMDRVKDDDRFWRPAGITTLLWLLVVAVWYLDMPGGQILSFGSGLWAAMLGVGLASSACFRRSASEFDGLAKVRAREADIDASLAAFASPSLEEEPAAQSPQPEAVAVQETETPKAALRFVARDVQISDEGVTASFASGETRKCLFADIGQVVARELPGALGYGPALLLDLVGSEGAKLPIRVLPETTVNYRYLPDGESEDANENVRRLIRLILALQPDIGMDEGSKQFTEGSGPALPFQTEAHFWKYDSRYAN